MKRFAAGMTAVVTAAAGTVAVGFQRDNRHEFDAETPTARHAVLDSPTQTTWDVIRELAAAVHDMAEAHTEAVQKNKANEIEELNNALRKSAHKQNAAEPPS